MQNPRYVPPNPNRRVHPNQQLGPRPSQLPPSQQSNGSYRPHEQPNGQYRSHEQPNGQYRTHEQPNDQYRSNDQPNGQYRTHDQPNNNFDSNDEYQLSIQSNLNEYPDNQGYSYPPPPPSQPIQKRVQIVDHNHQTPLSEHESQNSHSPEYNQKQFLSKQRRDHAEDNKSDSTLQSTKRSNNFKIHEYLYGLAAPDPGLFK